MLTGELDDAADLEIKVYLPSYQTNSTKRCGAQSEWSRPDQDWVVESVRAALLASPSA